MVQVQPPAYTVSNSGTETITSGNTSVTVTHGLGATPVVLSVNNLDDYGIGFKTTSIGATTFTINMQIPQPSNADFKWGASA